MKPRISPIVVLLAAATLSVDAVAVSLMHLIKHSQGVKTFFYSLTTAQLSAACVWAIFISRSGVWRWVGLIMAILFAAIVTAYSASENGKMIDFVALYGCYIALLTIALWIVKPVWRQSEKQMESDRWRYSVRWLLAIMTLVAVLSTLLKNADLLHQMPLFIFLWTLENVVIAVVAVLVLGRQWLWIMRLAVLLGAAGLLGWLLSLYRPNMSGYAQAMFIIHALVLTLWLTVGQILPVAQESPKTDNL